MLKKLIQNISYLDNYKIVILFYLIDVLISSIFSYLLFKNSTDSYKFSTLGEEFFIAVIVAPILETYIFQHILINILEKKTNNLNIIILSCGILFGIMHIYNIGYFLKGLISGVIYGILYISIRFKKSNPVLNVSICHSIYNLTAFLINNFF